MSTGLNQGNTVILTGGLKPVPITMRSRDAQIAEVLKMTNEDIALVFRVPFAMLGITGSPAGSAEALMHQWVASGLGFCLDHVERAFDQMFDLKGVPDEYCEFDTEALLRSAFKDRIAALKEGVTGGIFSPNEARNKEGLPDVKFGDEPRLQQQQVPLSAAAGIAGGMPAPGKTIMPSAPPAPPQPPAPRPTPVAGGKDAGAYIGREFLREAERIERAASL
jgi:phage portal protein BeeE